MKAVRKVKVLFLNAEDDLHESQRRLLGACKALGIEHKEVAGNIITLDVRRLTLVTADGEGKTQLTKLGRDLTQICRDNGVGLMIFDPLVEGQTGLDENSAQMTELIFTLRDVARDAKISVLLIHHSRKGGADGDQDSARGSSAIVNACRTVTTMTPMSREDAPSLLGKDRVEDHWRFIRVTGAKSNYAARGMSKWLEIKSAAIGNGAVGQDGEQHSDEVPMLVPADFGQAIDPEEWSRKKEFLARIAKGDDKGKPFAVSGPKNVYDLLEKEFGLTRKPAVPLVEALITKGALERREYKKSDRHTALGLFVPGMMKDLQDEIPF